MCLALSIISAASLAVAVLIRSTSGSRSLRTLRRSTARGEGRRGEGRGGEGRGEGRREKREDGGEERRGDDRRGEGDIDCIKY